MQQHSDPLAQNQFDRGPETTAELSSRPRSRGSRRTPRRKLDAADGGLKASVLDRVSESDWASSVPLSFVLGGDRAPSGLACLVYAKALARGYLDESGIEELSDALGATTPSSVRRCTRRLVELHWLTEGDDGVFKVTRAPYLKLAHLREYIEDGRQLRLHLQSDDDECDVGRISLRAICTSGAILSTSAFRQLVFYAATRNKLTGYSAWSDRKVSAVVGVSVRQVARNREALVDRGLILASRKTAGSVWRVYPQALPGKMRRLNQSVGPPSESVDLTSPKGSCDQHAGKGGRDGVLDETARTLTALLAGTERATRRVLSRRPRADWPQLVAKAQHYAAWVRDNRDRGAWAVSAAAFVAPGGVGDRWQVLERPRRRPRATAPQATEHVDAFGCPKRPEFPAAPEPEYEAPFGRRRAAEARRASVARLMRWLMAVGLTPHAARRVSDTARDLGAVPGYSSRGARPCLPHQAPLKNVHQVIPRQRGSSL